MKKAFFAIALLATAWMVSCTKEEGAVCKATLITKPEVTVAEYKGIHAPMKVREVTRHCLEAGRDAGA